MKLKVTVKTNENSVSPENAKERFWQTIIENGLSGYDRDILTTASKCENYLLTRFPSELKEKIISDLDSQITKIERDALGDLGDYLRYVDDRRSRIFDSEKGEGISEYYRTITAAFREFAELKKVFFEENENYKNLIEKRVIASHFIFNISNFRYASLGFDLHIEPAQKVIDFFDNNFEYLQVFFNSYVAEVFNDKFNDDNSIEMNYSVSVDNNFQPTALQNRPQSDRGLKDGNGKEASKFEKAKWYWSVVNGSLIFPVLISIYLIYSYSNKLDKLQDIQNQKLNSVFEKQEKLISYYQIEIKRLSELELKLLFRENKKDSLERK